MPFVVGLHSMGKISSYEPEVLPIGSGFLRLCPALSDLFQYYPCWLIQFAAHKEMSVNYRFKGSFQSIACD
jgi:hypothetical protein